MEVASLVITGVGLLSLANTVTECFERIDRGRNLGQDYEQKMAELQMARLAYNRWLNAVDIQEPNGSASGRVNLSATDKQNAEMLKSLLGLIEKAFQDAEKTGALYKIDDSALASKSTANVEDNELSKLGDDIRERANMRQRMLPIRNKIRWTFRDKKALEELVAKVSQNVKNLKEAFPAVKPKIETLAAEDVRSIADPTDAQNLPRLELMKNVATRTDPELERSVDQAIIEGHTYHNMKTGNKVKAHFGNQVFEGNVDPAWTRRRNQYKDGKASGNSQVMYGDQINPPKSFWD